MIVNLYEETTHVLKVNGKTWNDVRCLLICDKCISHHFAPELFNINYESSFGTEAINVNLKVVGDGWWLERAEYDGSEWWEFKTMPKVPERFNCDILEFAKLLRA